MDNSSTVRMRGESEGQIAEDEEAISVKVEQFKLIPEPKKEPIVD